MLYNRVRLIIFIDLVNLEDCLVGGKLVRDEYRSSRFPANGPQMVEGIVIFVQQIAASRFLGLRQRLWLRGWGFVFRQGFEREGW